MVRGRVLWHVGYSASKSAAAFTESYGAFQRTALQQEPAYQVRGALTDGFDSTIQSMQTLFPRARLGFCLRHALNKLPDKLIGLAAPLRKGLRSTLHRVFQSAAYKPPRGGARPAPPPFRPTPHHDSGRRAR